MPKGAELSHRNVVSNAVAGGYWSRSRQAGEVSIGALPVLPLLWHDGSDEHDHRHGLHDGVLVPDPRDVLHVMGSISKHRATLYSAVPTSYVRINSHPQVNQFDLRSIRVCLERGCAPASGGPAKVPGSHGQQAG